MDTEERPRKMFGDLYNEFVLTQKKLKEVELFGTICPRETELVQDLFSWKFVWGKRQIECGSEPEARFLQIFTEIGWQTVKVPLDEKYIAEILPRIQAFKDRADRLYFEREKTIFSRKLRNEVKFGTYRTISGTLEEYYTQKAKNKPRKSVRAVS